VPKTELNATLSALADRNRRAVIDLLKEQPRRAGEIAAALSLTPPALSRHLRVLRRSGLIREQGVEEDARVRIYGLRKEPFDQLRVWLGEVESFWTRELAAFRDHVESSKVRRKGPGKR
jgi:DNA-binding transcriptional ArsR family regulator